MPPSGGFFYLSNSKLNVFDKIKKITGKNPNLEIKDLKNKSEVKKLFSDYRFDGIIHFAAHKSVNESVNFPEKYYKNNKDNISGWNDSEWKSIGLSIQKKNYIENICRNCKNSYKKVRINFFVVWNKKSKIFIVFNNSCELR